MVAHGVHGRSEAAVRQRQLRADRRSNVGGGRARDSRRGGRGTGAGHDEDQGDGDGGGDAHARAAFRARDQRSPTHVAGLLDQDPPRARTVARRRRRPSMSIPAHQDSARPATDRHPARDNRRTPHQPHDRPDRWRPAPHVLRPRLPAAHPADRRRGARRPQDRARRRRRQPLRGLSREGRRAERRGDRDPARRPRPARLLRGPRAPVRRERHRRDRHRLLRADRRHRRPRPRLRVPGAPAADDVRRQSRRHRRRDRHPARRRPASTACTPSGSAWADGCRS